MVSLGIMIRAYRAQHAACTICGSIRISRSHAKPPHLARIAQLQMYRCRDCYRTFVLRADTPPADPAEPTEADPSSRPRPVESLASPDAPDLGELDATLRAVRQRKR